MSPPKLEARLVERPEGEWRHYVAAGWPVPEEPSLVRAVAMDRVFGIDHRDVSKAIDAPIWSPATRVRLRARHAKVIAAATTWPDLMPRSLAHVCEMFTEYANFHELKPAILARVKEATQTLTEFGAALENSLGRMLLIAYALPQYDEQSLSRGVTIPTFRAHRAAALTRIADVPVVAQDGIYDETTALSAVSVSAAPIKHGVIESITQEAVLNDDIMAIRRRVEDLGEAARRTVAKAVWNLWVSNGVYQGDAVAWFNAAHGNTGTVALAAASLKTLLTQLAAQTPFGSTERIGIPLRSPHLWMVVPPALLDTAYGLNMGQGIGDWAHGLFGEANERIVVGPPGMVDTNDWGLHYDASLVESVRVIYQGREEPELRLADVANMGRLFTHDRIQYRIHHHWNVLLTDYRAAQKMTVA